MEDHVRCAECQTVLAEGQDREVTEEAVFCRPCMDSLSRQLDLIVAAQSQNINYPAVILGGLGGAGLGVLVWWGFAALTKIYITVVSLVIGYAVGKGVVLLAEGKRHFNLQVVAVTLSTLAFFCGKFLVNRTFVIEAYAEKGEQLILPLLPSPGLFVEVIGLSFGIMDAVFLVIVLIQAWKMPEPFKISG